MAKAFDSTTKQLVQGHPADWLAFAGLPTEGKISVVDADISSFTAAADKVIRVDGPFPYIAHFEFQSGADLSLDGRVLLYNVLLRWRHGLPVYTIVILLRPEAAPAAVKGRVFDNHSSEHLLDFRYKIVRVWEQSVESLLAGGLGTLPLAPIASVAGSDLFEVIRKTETRLANEAPGEARDLAAAVFILLGLRYDKELVRKLLTGVRQMKESVTYQLILEEGELKALLRIATQKFGPPSAHIRQKIDAITDPSTIDRMVDKVLDASNWDQLVAE